jgi:uncharacterized repeat protein (TIGR03847 family)
MAEPESFGEVIAIVAEAIGQPGQRRFRLNAMNAGGRTATVWMEKEQLTALGDALETMLRDEGVEVRPRPPDDREETPVFPYRSSIDFQVGQLSMGVNRATRHVVIIAAEAGVDEANAAGVTLEVDYQRSSELRLQIKAVVAAGRAPCPLCGGPVDPSGHVCPRKNGHHKQG